MKKFSFLAFCIQSGELDVSPPLGDMRIILCIDIMMAMMITQVGEMKENVTCLIVHPEQGDQCR